MKRAALCLLLAGCAEKELGPAGFDLTAVRPAAIAARGGKITVVGERFPEGAIVKVDGVETTLVEARRGELDVVVKPRLAGRADIRVEVADGRSADLEDALEITPLALTFEVAPPYLAPDLGMAEVRAAGVIGTRVLAGTDQGLREIQVSAGRLVASSTAAVGPGDVKDLEVADLDGDGAQDVLLCTGTATPAVVRWGPSLARGALPPSGEPCVRAAVGDADGDGDLDLVALLGLARGAGVRVYTNQGARRFALRDAGPAWTLPGGAVDIAAGAGRILVLAADGKLTVLRPGPWHAEVVEAAAGADARALLAFDADGDGDQDALIAAAGRDHLLLDDGHGRFFDATATALPADRAEATAALAADLDRDGAPELLLGSGGQSDRLYRNRGDGRFDDVTPDFAIRAGETRALAVFDFDGDGDGDVLSLGTPPVLRVMVER